MAGSALFRRHRLVAVVRADTPDRARRAALACARGGLRMVEITFTVPGAAKVIEGLSDDPRLVVGAGTVTEVSQARAALSAGARFVVSPSLSEGVVRECRRRRVPVAPGAMTPTEVLRARALGADLVKIFPAHLLGGPEFIRALRAPFPDAEFLATGGISPRDIPAYLRAGAAAVGLGSTVVDPRAVRAGRWGAIAARARSATAALRRV